MKLLHQVKSDKEHEFDMKKIRISTPIKVILMVLAVDTSGDCILTFRKSLSFDIFTFLLLVSEAERKILFIFHINTLRNEKIHWNLE